MKKIGHQITYEKQGKSALKVEIRPVISQVKKNMLLLWGAAWTLCGLIIGGSLVFNDFKKEEYLGITVFLIFWIYFEIKVVHAIRWNRNGREVLHVKETEFSYLKSIGERGFPVVTDIKKLSPFKYAQGTESGLWNDINKSSWFVGGEVIEYHVEGAVKRIGMKLSKKDAQLLVNLLNKTAGL